jgi:hypothetical protein
MRRTTAETAVVTPTVTAFTPSLAGRRPRAASATNASVGMNAATARTKPTNPIELVDRTYSSYPDVAIS